jgi:hypothetical protein
MATEVCAWFMLTFFGGFFVAWILYKLYEHDYKKTNKENNVDTWEKRD